MNNRYIISSWLLLVAILMLLLPACRRKCAGEELPEPSTWGANTVGFRHNGQTYRFGKPDVKITSERIRIEEGEEISPRCRFGFWIELEDPANDTLPIGNEKGYSRIRIVTGVRIPLNNSKRSFGFVNDQKFSRDSDYSAENYLLITHYDPSNKVLCGQFECWMNDGTKVTDGRFDVRF
jgi:hypothetical protein